jgi:hypothetical protein
MIAQGRRITCDSALRRMEVFCIFGSKLYGTDTRLIDHI